MTERIGPAEHAAERPTWLCRDCGHLWPCATARQQLSDEMSGTELAINMYGYLEQFIKDRTCDYLSDGVFTRFVGWTHPTGEHP